MSFHTVAKIQIPVSFSTFKEPLNFWNDFCSKYAIMNKILPGDIQFVDVLVGKQHFSNLNIDNKLNYFSLRVCDYHVRVFDVHPDFNNESALKEKIEWCKKNVDYYEWCYFNVEPKMKIDDENSIIGMGTKFTIFGFVNKENAINFKLKFVQRGVINED